jgi:outer membrane protein assembly factor BamA
MMKANSRLALVVLVLVLLAPGWTMTSAAQKTQEIPPSQRRLIAIKIVGSKRFPEAAIAATTGLQIGAAASDDEFKKAAVRLGATGAFTDIGYSFSYSSSGTKVEFQVTDGGKWVPARFEDFVWFPDSELRKRIQEHVPLFDGELPLSGRMADQVSDVLQAMLVEHAISGHVDYVRASHGEEPIEAINFKVSEVLIRVRDIEFPGAGAAELPALQAAAERLPDREYSRSRLNQLVQKQLLPVYYSRGYLKAAFGDPQPKTATRPASEIEESTHNRTVVDVILPVTPGRQYLLKGMQWSGNHEFPTDTLAQLVRAQPGKPANTVRLAEDLQSVGELYGSRGFITASVNGDPD